MRKFPLFFVLCVFSTAANANSMANLMFTEKFFNSVLKGKDIGHFQNCQIQKDGEGLDFIVYDKSIKNGTYMHLRSFGFEHALIGGNDRLKKITAKTDVRLANYRRYAAFKLVAKNKKVIGFQFTITKPAHDLPWSGDLRKINYDIVISCGNVSSEHFNLPGERSFLRKL